MREREIGVQLSTTKQKEEWNDGSPHVRIIFPPSYGDVCGGVEVVSQSVFSAYHFPLSSVSIESYLARYPVRPVEKK
jgi:hypothetical protein